MLRVLAVLSVAVAAAAAAAADLAGTGSEHGKLGSDSDSSNTEGALFALTLPPLSLPDFGDADIRFERVLGESDDRVGTDRLVDEDGMLRGETVTLLWFEGLGGCSLPPPFFLVSSRRRDLDMHRDHRSWGAGKSRPVLSTL